MKTKVSLFNIFLLALVFQFSQCTIHLTPTASEPVLSLTGIAYHETDSLYQTMMASPDKTYDHFRDDYTRVNNEITEIRHMDSSRIHNKIILDMIKNIQDRFLSYEKDHQVNGVLSSDQFDSYQDYMDALWDPYYRAELNYKP